MGSENVYKRQVHSSARLPPVHLSADAVAGINPRYLLTFCQELHALARAATADLFTSELMFVVLVVVAAQVASSLSP